MDAFIGTILPWPLYWAPDGWALCNGDLLPISQNQALYALIGTTYGGNGTTNFALPNLCGRLPMGMGSTPGTGYNYVLGSYGGTATTTLAAANMPVHSHTATTQTSGMTCSVSMDYTIPAVNDAATTDAPSGTNCYLSKASYSGRPVQIYSDKVATPDVQMPGGTVTGNGSVSGNVEVTIGNSGSSMPFNNMPPYQVINYIIATTGIFPSRP